MAAQLPGPGPVQPQNTGRGSGSGVLSGTELQSAAALLQEATLRLQQRQYEAVLESVGNYRLLYPEHHRMSEADFYRLIAVYHLGRTEEARSGFNSLLTSVPQDARRFGVFYWLGLCSYKLGELDTGYDIWLRQLTVRGADTADYSQQSYFGLAQILTERGDELNALRYFRLLQGSTRRRAGFAYGALALKRGLYRESYNAFSAYLIRKETETGPSRAQALFYQGQTAFFAGLLPQAKQSLDSVLRLYSRDERLFLAALVMRLRIALEEKDSDTARRFYDQALALEQRYRHGMKDWLNATELSLFVQEGYYPLVLKYMRGTLARSRSRTEREIARFNVALALAFLDVRQAVRSLKKLEKSFIPDIRERALFHAARLQVSFPLTRSEGLVYTEKYLREYPEGLYVKEAVRILLRIYRSDPERFWLQASVLLEERLEDPELPQEERARFFLYRAEMARQLGNENAALAYLYRSWKLTPQTLVGLQSYYRSGAIYFAQKKYIRALGYFREVQLQLGGLDFSSVKVQGEAEELAFYAALAVAQSYAGAGQAAEALRRFGQLIEESRETQQGRNVQQVRLQQGLVYFYRKAYGQAVDIFDLIISQGVFPANQPEALPDRYTPGLMALYWKGEALFRQGLFSAARQSFRRVNEIYPEALGANAYLRAALASKAAEDYESVIEDLEQALPFVGTNLSQLLNIDFNLVKYNLLLGRDTAAIRAAKDMLEAVPPAYDFLGEAFMEVAELYFNRGDLARSQEVLSMLEKEFIRGLPSRESRAGFRLELYLEEEKPDAPYSGGLIVDQALNANLKEDLFSFDAEQFLLRYGATRSNPLPGAGNYVGAGGTNAAALGGNIDFYVQSDGANTEENAVLSSSIFSALYLQGLIHAEEKNYLEACKYFLQYLKKDRLGPYAVSAVSGVLRLIPELNVARNTRLFALLRGANLGDALSSVLFVRYWSLQNDKAAKKRALEKIIRQTLSINARKEAMYHLAVYYRKRNDPERVEQLLLRLRNVKGGSPALDSENYWVGLANLELGRTAYQGGNFGDAKVFLQAITGQAQVERETLAEALYWLSGIAHFEGNAKEEEHYRQSLQNLAPGSEWLRKLN
ncbi:tetratricopeptide repeat protein [Candidatus Haliotispira prima]|uniref:Tetratricopeptide repeat protein n=1 Tax=Candidatus Haliotispira prima TaxID=3034016 RepID=A0ABY8MHB5_9SPIO|nr:tetratricopeptide repeat protein [Candidatus Haliotispira prima]